MTLRLSNLPIHRAARLLILFVAMAAPCSRVVHAQVPCPGDCNEDGIVGVAELIRGVNISLGIAPVSTCPAMDVNGNGAVAINELVAAVNAALGGCPGGEATFAEVQAIFTANCTMVGCHSGAFPANGLSLVAGVAYDELVGVTPFNLTAANDGLLLVDPGNANNSFLVRKVAGTPPIAYGALMPLFADPLSEADVRTIREWVDAGANP